MKLKLFDIKARVGIMLVPFHQSHPELLVPGLCMNIQKMDEEGLLDGLKKYEWFPDQSSCVHTIKLPCNIFKEESLDRYQDESTKTLKEEAYLKDIFRSDATIGMLCRVLGLLKLKVEDKDESEGKGTKDAKGSVRLAPSASHRGREAVKPVNKGAKGKKIKYKHNKSSISFPPAFILCAF